MNPISYLKPLRIQIGAATVKVGNVSPCCGSVRVEGWIDAPCKREGFGASLALGAHLGRKSVGGYCDARTEFEAVSFPFSFDMESECVAPRYRREEMEETIRRVILTLWRARRHFAKLARGRRQALT
jgi:hypothetical protein